MLLGGAPRSSRDAPPGGRALESEENMVKTSTPASPQDSPEVDRVFASGQPLLDSAVRTALTEFSPDGLEFWLRNEGISANGAKLLLSMLEPEDHLWLAALRLLYHLLDRDDINPFAEIAVRTYTQLCKDTGFRSPLAERGHEFSVFVLKGRFYLWLRDRLLPAVEARGIGARVARVDAAGRRVEGGRVPRESLLRRLFLDKVGPQIPDAHTGALLRVLSEKFERVLPPDVKSNQQKFAQEIEALIALEPGKKFIYQKQPGRWDWSGTRLVDAIEKHFPKLRKAASLDAENGLSEFIEFRASSGELSEFWQDKKAEGDRISAEGVMNRRVTDFVWKFLLQNELTREEFISRHGLNPEKFDLDYRWFKREIDTLRSA
jgi:hypothetical protein